MAFKPRLQFALLAVVVGLTGTRLARAQDASRVTAVMPLVAQAQSDAKKWQADAALVGVLVYAEPDGAVHLSNLGGPGEVDVVLATFVSTDAEQIREYLLSAKREWIPLKPVPFAREEAILPISPKVLDLDEAIKMVSTNNFKLPPAGKGNYLRAHLQVWWNAVDRSGEPWWELQSIVATPDRLEKTFSSMAAGAVAGMQKVPDKMTEHRSAHFLVQQFPLGRLPVDNDRHKFIEVSDEMRHLCYIEGGEVNEQGQFIASKDQNVRVVWDGVAGPLYDRIDVAMTPSYTGAVRSPAFSEEDGHLIYSAARDKRCYVVVDGRPFAVGSAPRDGSIEIVWQLAFSRDGSRWACVVTRTIYDENDDKVIAKESQLVVDGKNYGDPVRLELKNATDEERATSLIYPGMQHPVFSQDNRHFAYIAGQPGKMCVVVDGVAEPDFDEIHLPESYPKSFSSFLPLENLQFTPDSRGVVYAAIQDGKFHIVRNGKPGRALDHAIHIFAVSPNGQRVAYTDGFEGRYSIFVDGGPPTPEVGPVFGAEYFDFSPDSSRYAYIKYADEDQNSPTWVVDGIVGASYKDISEPAFSADGKHVSFIAEKEDSKNAFIITDGVETDTAEEYWSGVLEISSKGESAYTARVPGDPEFKQLMRGKDVALFGDTIHDFRFSPDGSRLACVATDDKLSEAVFFDTELDPVPEFPFAYEVRNLLKFDSNDRLHYLSVKDGEVSRIEVKLLKP